VVLGKRLKKNGKPELCLSERLAFAIDHFKSTYQPGTHASLLVSFSPDPTSVAHRWTNSLTHPCVCVCGDACAVMRVRWCVRVQGTSW
jgi:hypothetical protein